MQAAGVFGPVWRFKRAAGPPHLAPLLAPHLAPLLAPHLAPHLAPALQGDAVQAVELGEQRVRVVADVAVVARQHAAQQQRLILLHRLHKVLVVTGQQEHCATLAGAARHVKAHSRMSHMICASASMHALLHRPCKEAVVVAGQLEHCAHALVQSSEGTCGRFRTNRYLQLACCEVHVKAHTHEKTRPVKLCRPWLVNRPTFSVTVRASCRI